MPNKNIFYSQFGALFFLLLLSCCNGNEEKQRDIVLDSRYQQIESIRSIAACSSPQGKYSTEVFSSTDGSCEFIQIFENDTVPFVVKVNSLNQGFVIQDNRVRDTLAAAAVAMIRGHEIHKMMSLPSYFFSNLEFHSVEDLSDEKYEIHKGTDGLGHPARLYYDPKMKLISKLELRNPLDTLQTIEITGKSWRATRFGKMVEEVDIVQAKKDTFHFRFEHILIND